MNFPGHAPPAGKPLLRAAQAAIERGELQLAAGLFVEHFVQARDDALGLYNFGSFCLSRGLHASAYYLLRKASALGAGDSDVLSHLGYAQIALKDFEGARLSFESVVAQAPAHAPANYGLGLCYQQAGEWPAAVEAFAKTLSAQSQRLSKAELPILLKLAEACHQAGDSESARRHFANAEQIAPDDLTMLLSYGKFLREQGAVKHAMQLIDRCGRQNPADPTARLEKARCLRALEDPMQAMRWLERLEKSSPGLPENSEEYGYCQLGPTGTQIRELHWARAAGLWVKADEFDRAESILDRLLAANPMSAMGWNARGKFEGARHRLDAAEVAYQKAIACDPT